MGSAAVFWDWFVTHEARFRTEQGAAKEALLDELLAQLHRFSEELYFLIGGAPGGPIELVITADGCVEAFDHVRALVGAAPRLKGWRFVAFKPAAGFSQAIEFEGARIDPRKAWFMPLESKLRPEHFGVRLACDAYVEALREEFATAAQMLLEAGLGELAAHEQVQFLDVERTPASPADLGYLELPALSAYLDWRKTRPGTP